MKRQEEEPICIQCDKKNQKDLPANDTASSQGMPCEQSYLKVRECMNQNEGQVSSCRKEWDVFKQCHENQKP
jgi:hypothetical protein